MVLYLHELKSNLKSFLIWTACVGGMCFACILLYSSLQDSMSDMLDAYSNMGAFSTALGMDQLSIATLSGFYATEIGIMHSLGGAMFAALTGAVMISKEEAGHTAEFLNVFPIGRKAVLMEKYAAFLTLVLLFNLFCVIMYVIGFAILGEEIETKQFLLYHLAQILMQVEIGTICFMISAFVKKNLIGAGLGIAVIFYAMDLMCRIIPAIKILKYITPFYYSNASDIFVNKKIDTGMALIGVAILVVSFVIALIQYEKKDLAV